MRIRTILPARPEASIILAAAAAAVVVLGAAPSPVAAAAPDAAARTVRVRPAAAPAGAVVADASRGTCEIGNTNPVYYALEDWIWGEESYYHVARPGVSCGIGGAYRVVAVHFMLDLQAADVPTSFTVQAGLNGAVLEGGCWKPGPELCRSPEAEFSIDAPGLWQLVIPVPETACVADASLPCFVAVHFPTAFPADKRPAGVSDASPLGCRSYNDYGDGAEDLVADYDWPGEILLSAEIEPADAYVPSHAALALRWAPMIYQDTGSTPRHDYLTRFDFDGDWNAWNNFDSLSDGAALPACVYWSVQESATDWWVTYGFFHPYDSSALGKSCDLHENDFEGVVLTVRKTGGPYGVVQAMSTEAHGQVFCFTPYWSEAVIGGDYQYLSTNPNHLDNGLGCQELGPSLPIYCTVPDSTLNISANPSTGNATPAVFIEAEGHGVGRLSRALESGSTFPFGVGWYDFYDDDGVLYYCDGGPAEEPAGAGTETIRYELRPLSELWDRRHDLAADGTFCGTADFLGSRGCALDDLAVSFGGACLGVGGSCAAQPPWGWASDASGLVDGEWFLDPAAAVVRHLHDLPESVLPGFDEYLANPFLQGDQWIRLTEPAGPATWRAGETVRIAWERADPAAQGPPPVQLRIQLSRDGGVWETIASGLDPAAGHLDWVVTGDRNAVCRLRLDATTDCGLHIYDAPDFDVAVPAALQFFSAERRPDGALVRWSLADGTPGRWRLHRAAGGGARIPVAGAVSGADETGSFVDPEPPASAVEYWLRGEDGPSAGIWLGPALLPAAAAVRGGPRLAAARPNPCNPSTTVSFVLSRTGPVTIAIHDVRGRRVAVLRSGILAAGEHEVRWDGRTDGGAAAESGVYFVRLDTREGVRTQKILLLK